MATRPKRRKRTSATIVSSEEPPSSGAAQPDPSTPLQSSMMEDMVSSCLAAITPALKETVQQCIRDFHEKPNQDATSVAAPQISLLEDLTNPPQGNSCSTPASSSISLTLGVDDKLRRSIHEGQYVKFASLLPPENESTDNRYRSVEKEGQLIFVKHSEKNSIHNITKWMEAFHIFVAVYSEKSPHEIGSLMTPKLSKRLQAPVEIRQHSVMMRSSENGEKRTLLLALGIKKRRVVPGSCCYGP